MTPIFFEGVIIKYLFTKTEVRERAFPYLDPKLFSDFNHVAIVKSYMKFFNDFKKYPTVSDLKLTLKEKEVYDALDKIVAKDLSEHADESILRELEIFFQKKLIFNEVARVVESIKDEDLKIIQDAPDKLREALAFSFSSQVGMDLVDGVEEFYDWLHSPNRTISSGLSCLDYYIEGGFAKETLSVFMGESNIGKSITLAALAVNCLMQKNNVLYLTLEMSDFKTARRMLANLFDIPIGEMKAVTKATLIAKKEEMEKELDRRLILQKYPTGTMTANHIRNLLKELKMKKGFVPDIIFIDYLGIMKPINSKREGNMYQDVKTICEEVRAIAVENDVPIVSVAQISKGGYSSAEIELKDVAESMGLIHTCDVIVGITQSEEMRAASKFTFAILKNRDGMNKQKIYVDIDYSKMRISEPMETDPENPIGNVTSKQTDLPKNSAPMGIVDSASVDVLKTKTNKTESQDGGKKSFLDFE